ncbi:tannase/feruloyl esterase family alpha/beta hydrolase [Pseudomonas putida]
MKTFLAGAMLALLSLTTHAQHIAALPAVPATQSCAALKTQDLTALGGAGSHVDSASETAGHCVVMATLAPSIGVRISLPLTAWTQRYLQVGCGGLCGNISTQVGAAQGCAPLDTGAFVTGATNMGHEGNSSEFGQDPQKRVDFAYRSQHLTALLAKQLIKAFYDQPAAYAYFNGCSDGGREALMEAQRYPDDFNGIIAGAAALNFQVQNALYHAWQAHANEDANGKPILVAGRLSLLHEAVLKQCDALDGQADRLISDPRACHFDPATIECKAGQDTSQCLTAAEVGAVRKLYDGPHDASGKRLTIGGPQPGSELAWGGVFVPMSADQPIFSQKIALDALQNVSFATNPTRTLTLADARFDQATFDQLRTLHPLYDATNPDLSAFAGRGGKLIIWHGWADPHISPLNSLAYHQAVVKQMGQTRVDQFERLYLLPGVHHCNGGEGPSQLDLLTPMMSWVERQQAPDAILTTQANAKAPGFGAPMVPPAGALKGKLPPMGPMSLPVGAADQANAGRSRPLYPFPYVAVYNGKGDPQVAGSYHRGGPISTTPTPDWRGADFFMPYKAQQ